MRRSEYLETIEGQMHEKFKRSMDVLYLSVNHEPKSKNSISSQEKRDFRQTIKNQLKKYKRRAFRGDIILEMDFQTTKNNPPAIQTLVKNYLDLLHKPIPEIDINKEILFKDDSQIKILIANYHLDELSIGKPEIRIKAYRYSHFIKDVELADRIRHDDFKHDFFRSFHTNRHLDEDEERSNRFNESYYEDLKELKEGKEWYDKNFGPEYYNLQKHFLIRQIQEQYLKQNNLSLNDLISLFQASFIKNKKYSNDDAFQNLLGIASKLISVSMTWLELGGAPVKKGDKKIFKKHLGNKLNDFKEKYKLLFPLLHPIRLTVFYTPPISNILDLDNLARYIIPLITDIFKPPSTLNLSYNSKFLNQSLKRESRIIQSFPENGIGSYQLIYRPRKEESPEEGEINLFISDGLFSSDDIWWKIDRYIEKWEE